VIPAALVDRIEVYKTLSANQDADAIGGSINMVTKTAGEKPTISLEGMGGYTRFRMGAGSIHLTAALGGDLGKARNSV